jgi:hypothetical protein
MDEPDDEPFSADDDPGYRSEAAHYQKRAAKNRAMPTAACMLSWVSGGAPSPRSGYRGPVARGDDRVGDGRRWAAGEGGKRP